jgi:hypothetical protein
VVESGCLSSSRNPCRNESSSTPPSQWAMPYLGENLVDTVAWNSRDSERIKGKPEVELLTTFRGFCLESPFIPANVLGEGVARAGSKAVFFFRSN